MTNSITAKPSKPLSTDTRSFLNWNAPILPAVVSHLIEDYQQSGTLDLRGVLLVVPGGLASRRLAELLSIEAEQHSLVYYPPEIVTIGGLPEFLYQPQKPFVSDLTQNMLWAESLQKLDREKLLAIVSKPPTSESTQSWLELGKMIAGVHRELAIDGQSFRSVLSVLDGFHPEAKRWQALSDLQSIYLRKVSDLGLCDIHTARREALEERTVATSRTITLVSCVELHQTHRDFLNAVSKRVKVYVAAPPELAERFDALGCLIPAKWLDQDVPLQTEQLFVTNTPADAAVATTALLAQWGERFHVKDITIGVPDPEIIPVFRHQIERCGLRARYGPGSSLSRSEPITLLDAIGDYLAERRYTPFATLLRHPAVHNLLHRAVPDLPNNWLSLIDQYVANALPKTIDEHVRQLAEHQLEDKSAHASIIAFQTIRDAIHKWLHPLITTDASTRSEDHGQMLIGFESATRPLSQWVEPLAKVLNEAYHEIECDLNQVDDQLLAGALRLTNSAILSLSDLPQAIEPELSVHEAVDWVVRSTNSVLIPEPPDHEAIEMLGWLELALDDTPALIIAGMHDGVTPESVNGDAFLPNRLRRDLAMLDNNRRCARDIYSFCVMLHSKADVRVVVSRTSPSGDPYTPSRLLMACQLQLLPRRVMHLVNENYTDRLPGPESRWRRVAGKSQLVVPKPIFLPGDRLPSAVTVTAFRSYLACPYRYYLNHVRKLRAETDSMTELDAAMFGNLIHDSLMALGTSSVGKSTDPLEIEQFLLTELERLARMYFGGNPPVAAMVQFEQAKQRLKTFSKLQADRAAEGWEIRFTEQGTNFDDKVQLGEGKHKLCLIGRIDRIDFNPRTGQWAIWDYKTSDTAKDPLKVHLSEKDEWLDLQLPLYRHVAKKLGVKGNPSVGYITLAKSADTIEFRVAQFTDEQLAAADREANRVAACIARCEFEPIHGEPAEVEFDDFKSICLMEVEKVDSPPPVESHFRFNDEFVPAIDTEVSNAALHLTDSPVRTYPKFEPLLIRASAGTGKTFQLSNRLLQIILSGQEVDGVLATTFTRKAAGEILHRVLQRLAEACISPAAQKLLRENLDEVDCSPAACLAALRRLTRTIHRLRIGTLDSFFAQLARTFALDIGLPAGWSPLDPSQAETARLEAIGDMLESNEQKYLSQLLHMLFKGESKRSIAQQLNATVASGYEVFRMSKEEDWNSLQVPSQPSEEALESAMRTIAVTQFLTKSNKPHQKTVEGIEKLLQSLRSGNWEEVLQHTLIQNASSDSPKYYNIEYPANFLVAIENVIDRLRFELLNVQRLRTTAIYQLLKEYDRHYTNRFRRTRMLSFSDVTHLLATWISSGAKNGLNSATRATQFAFRLDCGVDHLLLDEFQDTSPMQWTILREIAAPLGGQARSDQSFFCVGDTKQAIYGWRGGVAEIFDSVTKVVQNLKISSLEQSFRSSPEIMEVTNRVFQNLTQHEHFGDAVTGAAKFATVFPEHVTFRKQQLGYVELVNLPATDSEQTASAKREQSLQFIAERIHDLTVRSACTVGVLLRSNDDIRKMISVLREKGVSASQLGGNPLTDSMAVQLLMSAFRLADHPGDSIASFHICHSPLHDQVGKDHRTGSIAFSLRLRQMVARHGLGRAVERLANDVANHLSWWDQFRLEQLCALAHAYQPSWRGRFDRFCEFIETSLVPLPTEAQVKVMTVHGSKGLEFDAVFLPALDKSLTGTSDYVLKGDDPCEPPSGVLPWISANLVPLLPETWQRAFELKRSRLLTESLCLLYVAITRARHALYMFSNPRKSKAPEVGNATYESLLQSTLTDDRSLLAVPEATLYQIGNNDWFKTYPTASPAQRNGQTLAASPQSIQLRNDAASQPLRNLTVMTPSASGELLTKIKATSFLDVQRSVGASIGRLQHAFLEQIQWLDDFAFDEIRLRQAAKNALNVSDLSHVNIRASITQFREFIEGETATKLLRKSRYGDDSDFATDIVDRAITSFQVDNERPFSLIVDRQRLAGTLDRLVLLKHQQQVIGAEIIDYKTDMYPGGLIDSWVQERADFHRPQLQEYARVVSLLYQIPVERIRCTLVLLSVNRFITYGR